jgi:hypothetical protein
MEPNNNSSACGGGMRVLSLADQSITTLTGIQNAPVRKPVTIGSSFLKPSLSLLARLLELSPRSLRYLKVQTWAWRIARDLDSGRAVRLQGMDAFEQAEIELFLDYPFHMMHTALLNLHEGDGRNVQLKGTLHWREIHNFDLAKFYSGRGEQRDLTVDYFSLSSHLFLFQLSTRRTLHLQPPPNHPIRLEIQTP